MMISGTSLRSLYGALLRFATGDRRNRHGVRHQRASSGTPHAALARWADLFVDFLVTKHGLAAALQSGQARFETLHAYFLDRLVPACAQLLDAAAEAGEIGPDVDPFALLYGIGNLCAGAGGDSRYDARGMAQLLIAGLRAGDDSGAVKASNRA